jgi:hypothetical protein
LCLKDFYTKSFAANLRFTLRDNFDLSQC